MRDQIGALLESAVRAPGWIGNVEVIGLVSGMRKQPQVEDAPTRRRETALDVESLRALHDKNEVGAQAQRYVEPARPMRSNVDAPGQHDVARERIGGVAFDAVDAGRADIDGGKALGEQTLRHWAAADIRKADDENRGPHAQFPRAMRSRLDAAVVPPTSCEITRFQRTTPATST